MNRRTFLTATGTATVTGIAGCLGTFTGGTTSGSPSDTVGPTTDDGLLPDDNPQDGYPPSFEQTPDQRSIDTASFETVDRDGVAVPLAPIEAVYYWYTRGEARFADTRDRSHTSNHTSTGQC